MRFEVTFNGSWQDFIRMAAPFIRERPGYVGEWTSNHAVLGYFFGPIEAQHAATWQEPLVEFSPLGGDLRQQWLMKTGYVSSGRALAGGRIKVVVEALDEVWPEVQPYWEQWRAYMEDDGWIDRDSPDARFDDRRDRAFDGATAFDASSRRGLSEETQKRFDLAWPLHLEHPDWSYQDVANHLRKTLSEEKLLTLKAGGNLGGEDIENAVAAVRRRDPDRYPKWSETKTLR